MTKNMTSGWCEKSGCQGIGKHLEREKDTERERERVREKR